VTVEIVTVYFQLLPQQMLVVLSITCFFVLVIIVFLWWYIVEESLCAANEQTIPNAISIHEEKSSHDDKSSEVDKEDDLIIRANNHLNSISEDDLSFLDSLVAENDEHFENIIDKEDVPLMTTISSFQYENCYDLGVSQADIGLIVPFLAHSTDFNFRPFQLVEDLLKNQTVDALQTEFGKKITKEVIGNTWIAGNVLYVLSFKHSGGDKDFIGCVCVDRHQFYPFISNLVVHTRFRRKKFGQLLLRLAERYAERFQFPSVKLWCTEKLVPYYEKQGYGKESYDNEQQVFILYKPFEKKVVHK